MGKHAKNMIQNEMNLGDSPIRINFISNFVGILCE